MITKKKSCPPASRRFRLIATMIFFLVASAALALILPVETEHKATVISAAYALLVTCFLVAQFWGFIVSQTEYNDTIEAPKFALLENEEIEWRP